MCKALSLSTDNVRRSLKPDQVNSVKLTGLRGLPPLLVTEAGLYRLVMRSTKPEAVEFQDRVTDVVLPAIRKDGA